MSKLIKTRQLNRSVHLIFYFFEPYARFVANRKNEYYEYGLLFDLVLWQKLLSIKHREKMSLNSICIWWFLIFLRIFFRKLNSFDSLSFKLLIFSLFWFWVSLCAVNLSCEIWLAQKSYTTRSVTLNFAFTNCFCTNIVTIIFQKNRR